MKTQHVYISLFLSLNVFAGCATGGVAYRKPPSEDWRNTKPTTGPMMDTQLPIFESTRLNNGLQVILVKESNLPIVTYELLVKAGSSSEKSRDAGLASMVSKMLLEVI